jgi:hypothetical protein
MFTEFATSSDSYRGSPSFSRLVAAAQHSSRR